jgi:Kinesin-like protein
MTTILRDSLGGNCKTVMIATISSDLDNIDETISTSRFAQRCAKLYNEVIESMKIIKSIRLKRMKRLI